MSAEALRRTSGALDYGHALEFGYFLSPNAEDPQAVLETARLVDELGYDLIGVQDHPYQSRHLDTMSLLAAILAQTTSVRVFADVGNLPLRPPSVLTARGGLRSTFRLSKDSRAWKVGALRAGTAPPPASATQG